VHGLKKNRGMNKGEGGSRERRRLRKRRMPYMGMIEGGKEGEEKDGGEVVKKNEQGLKERRKG
jgi:hypothetical protein